MDAIVTSFLEDKSDPLSAKSDPLSARSDPLSAKSDPLSAKSDPLSALHHQSQLHSQRQPSSQFLDDRADSGSASQGTLSNLNMNPATVTSFLEDSTEPFLACQDQGKRSQCNFTRTQFSPSSAQRLSHPAIDRGSRSFNSSGSVAEVHHTHLCQTRPRELTLPFPGNGSKAASVDFLSDRAYSCPSMQRSGYPGKSVNAYGLPGKRSTSGSLSTGESSSSPCSPFLSAPSSRSCSIHLFTMIAHTLRCPLSPCPGRPPSPSPPRRPPPC